MDAGIQAGSLRYYGSLVSVLGEWMEPEVREQIEILASVGESYAEQLSVFQGKSFEMVLLAARGSSDHAALYARYLIEIHLQIPAVLVAPSVLTRYHSQVRYPKSLVVGISQSGSGPDVAEVLAYAGKAGHETLAITNTPGSLLHQGAKHCLLLGIGKEQSVAATKTYSASLLALYQLVRVLGGSLPSPALPSADWMEVCRSQAESDALRLIEFNPVFSLGRGYSFATANEAALKLMECALIPARAYSTADFEHGPKALATSESALVAFSQINPALEKQGAHLFRAPVPKGVEEEVLPIWQIFYGQWLALYAARLRGHDPDQPQFIQKVTKTL